MSGERSILRDRAIEEHLPLVRHLARGFVRRGVEMDDLVQVGAIGLINAVDRFEAARGVSLMTYATPCIVGEIQRHLRDRAHVVRVPRKVQQDRARRTRVEAHLADTRRRPVRSERAEEGTDGGGVDPVLVGDPIQDLIAHLADARWHEAVDESEVATNRVAVSAALRGLDARERQVVKRRFFDDLRQDQIAAELGISQVQVSRLLRSCLERLRVELDDRVVVGTSERP